MKRVLLAVSLFFVSSFQSSAQSSACHGNDPTRGCAGIFTGMVAPDGTVFNLPANNANGPIEISTAPVADLLPAKYTLVHLMPWFTVGAASATYPRPKNDGSGEYENPGFHVETGYNSNDPNTVAAQLADIHQRGFDGVMINWYGPNRITENGTTVKVRDRLNQAYCASGNCLLKFGIVEDQGSWRTPYPDYPGCQSGFSSGDQTTCIREHLRRDFFFLDSSFTRQDSYLRTTVTAIDQSGGRPVTHFFVADNDWNVSGGWAPVYENLRQTTSGFGQFNPQFIFRNAGGFNHSSGQSDGSFSWIEFPDRFTPDPDWSFNRDIYLPGFYNAAASNTQKQAWGAVYKGYDERRSGFEDAVRIKYISQRCGRIWLESIQKANTSYSGLKFVQVPTWNDYDEGSQIESGIDNCVNPSSFGGNTSGDTLNWSFLFNSADGTPDTIHKYELYRDVGGSLITVDTNISHAVNCSFNTSQWRVDCSLNLSNFTLDQGTHQLRIKQISKNSLTNHMFPGSITYEKSAGGGCFYCDVSCNPLYLYDPYCNGGCTPPPFNQCQQWNYEGCFCGDPSPILIDTTGDGFHLTSKDNGVMFDFEGVGTKIKISWTEGAANNYFLVLDRNGNGAIDNGSELFGNKTPQPASQYPTGFLALAEYDKPQNGGNGDGLITSADSVYSQLRLWKDANHDGISQGTELATLASQSVNVLEFAQKESGRRDKHGNRFRYRAKVNHTGTSAAGRWAYDVIFVMR